SRAHLPLHAVPTRRSSDLTSLSQAEQLAEIEEWFDAAKAKYPDLPMIDVVNEAHPNHAPAPFKNALGGDGATGYDWIMKSFQMRSEEHTSELQSRENLVCR